MTITAFFKELPAGIFLMGSPLWVPWIYYIITGQPFNFGI